MIKFRIIGFKNHSILFDLAIFYINC